MKKSICTVLYALDLVAGIDNDELYRVERVGCVRSAVIVNCVISIAMVGGDENHVVVLDGLGNDLLDAAVNASDSGADGVVNSGVADHVAVRVVQDDEVFLVGVDSFNELLGYDRSAHLRLEIVCRHLWRRNQDSVLVLERSFAAAVEEECNVSIFLCFGNAELVESCLRYDFTEGVLDNLLVEEDMEALECSIVRSHAAVIEIRNDVHSLLRHVLLGEHCGDFTCAVIAEIHEDNGVCNC